MPAYKPFLPFAGSLIAFMFIAGIPSAAIAEPRKLTVCHVPTAGKDDADNKKGPTTLTLPAEIAKGHLASHPGDFTGVCGGTRFSMVAVSGTLEEGFPLRPNLDFITEVNEGNAEVRAIFLGHALVRGVRAFLDMKDPASREFRDPPALNPVNPALVATGNNNDANISSIYLIDRRQALRALLHEPRYLSMVPDLAKVDIHAAETDESVRKLLLQAIRETPGITNQNQATVLQVISTWKSCHFVPSPVLTTKPDGTRVTDFPNSLAKFAGTTDAERTGNPAVYSAKVEAAVRAAVEDSKDCIDNPSTFPPPVAPDALIRYAVDKTTKRMNDTYRPCEFEEFAARAGVNIKVEQCPN